MLQIKKLHPSKTVLALGAMTCLGLLSSCGGELLGGQFSAEFLYVPNGTNVTQNALTTTGQVTALNPATATSTNATAIAINKELTHAYAVNTSSNTISQYSMVSSGQLSALTPGTVVTDTSPVAIAESNDSKYVYVLNSGTNTITEYSVGTGGTLTALTPSSVSVAAGGNSLTVSPNGSYLYATSFSSNTVSAFAIGTDGQLTPLSTPTYTLSQPYKPTFSADGTHLYIPSANTGIAQYNVGVDGSLTPMSTPVVAGPAAGTASIAFSPNGLYAYVAADNGGGANSPVGQYNVGTDGSISPMTPATVTAGTGPTQVVVEPSGKFVFVMNLTGGTISQFAIGADGTLTANTPSSVTLTGCRQMVLVTR